MTTSKRIQETAKKAVIGQAVGQAMSALGSLISTSQPVPVVGYHFECGDVEWHVRHVSIEETLGTPYRYTVQLVTDDTDILIEEFVGANATLEVTRDDKIRYVKGYVEEIEHLGVVSHRTRIRVHVVPALAWLARTRGSRIFQEQTIPEIIKAVVEPVLSARGRSLDVATLDQRGFQPREYCVQFHESDLDFLHRLLEEEGLTYFFDQAREAWETVVFTTMNDDFPTFEGLDGSREVPVNRGDETPDTESISAFDWTRRARAPRVHQRDWDWKPNPPQIYEATHENASRDDTAIDAMPAIEVYESGDHRLLEPAVEARAERKQQAFAVLDASGVGRSNVTGFTPGTIFELVHDDHAGRYLLTRVTHEGDAPHADVVGGGAAAAPSYENRFHCIPAGTPYRPLRSTVRPSIPGPQTAVVTGPEGEEIHTDEHGRIKVRMHWDRANTPPEDSSCWLRVAQMWSGPGWGSVFLPRVGMEVIVTFINGDPDRPLVTGCVYNGGNRPPYPLPDEKTKSTIKSSSSPGGDGYNELTFEDAAGAEQIILHAQKDLNESVGGSHSTSVGGSQSNTVGGNQSETVSGNATLTVTGTREKTVTQAETITNKSNRSTEVTGSDAHTVIGAFTETFHATRTTKVSLGAAGAGGAGHGAASSAGQSTAQGSGTGGSRATRTKSGASTVADHEIIISGNKIVNVEAGSLYTYAATRNTLSQGKAGDEHVLVLENGATLHTTTNFTISNGKVTVQSNGGVLSIVAKDAIVLSCGEGNAASVTLNSEGKIAIQGKIVEINGTKQATVAAAGNSLTAEPGGVTISGSKITAQSSGLHEIKGSLIKIN